MSSLSENLKILGITKEKIYYAFDKAWKDYMKDIKNYAQDIYDSCIKCYYADYIPVKYDRHGNIRGKNLFYANKIQLVDGGDDIRFFFDEMSLLPYSGPEKREIILNQIMNEGLRGGGSRSKGSQWRDTRGNQWPMEWEVHYPNKFSIYKNVWYSDETTIDGIFDDFLENIVPETKDNVVKYFMNYVLQR